MKHVYATIGLELLTAPLCLVAFRTEHDHPHTTEDRDEWLLTLQANLAGSFLLVDALVLFAWCVADDKRREFLRGVSQSSLILPGMSSSLVFFSVSFLSTNALSNYLLQGQMAIVIVSRLYIRP